MADTQPKLGVSLVQVVGSALAAVTAAVIASRFGVGGTMIGTAVASVIATTGTAVYTKSLKRANDRLLTLHITEGMVRRRPGPADVPAAPPAGEPATATTAGSSAAGARGRWPVAATVVVVFLLAMGLVTGVEVLAGRPLSSLFGGGHDKGTSVSRVLGGGGAPAPRPRPTRAAVPTGQASPTGPPSPTGQPSPSPSSPPPTAGPSASPPASPPTTPPATRPPPPP